MEEELRRANIVYFLAHGGTVERPRVITVHHLHNDRVHLHDVKRWLAELRGKDMPDSYSWSYKRRYKNGYKWHELKDDDLIAPISENEYVLKGSFIRFYSLDGFSYEDTDKRVMTSKQMEKHQTVTEHKLEPKVSQQLEHESWISSNQELDSKDRMMAVIKIEALRKKQEEEQQKHKRRYSSGTSHVFCNILTCKRTDANDSVLQPANRAHGRSHERRSNDAVPHQQQKNGTAEAENSRKGRRNNGGKRSTKRTPSVKYKPAGAPNCSQCGRRFDPEKFQSHMRSCKALKGRAKARLTSDRKSLRKESQSEEFSRESIAISGYLA